MHTIVLMVMCIARMIYLMIPVFTIIIGIQVIVYKVTRISLYNKLIKKLEAVTFGDGTTSK